MVRPYRRLPAALIPYLPEWADVLKQYSRVSPYKILADMLGVHAKTVEYQILRERKRQEEDAIARSVGAAQSNLGTAPTGNLPGAVSTRSTD